MESPYYEMTHDFEEENRLLQSGYAKGYYDAMMKCPGIIRCKDCKHCVKELNGELYCDILAIGYEPFGSKKVTAYWFCADGERR